MAFAGRSDRQVKIAGRRVALDEMEAELRADPAVREAAVTLRNGRAVAHVTGAVDGLTLRRALLARLPPHMVPSTITALDAMPLTASGKLDRKALPATGTQAAVAAIWRDVLGELPPDANLFDAGASSLDVVRAHAALRDAGLDVALTDLFAFPSIAALAARLDGTAEPACPAGRRGGRRDRGGRHGRPLPRCGRCRRVLAQPVRRRGVDPPLPAGGAGGWRADRHRLRGGAPGAGRHRRVRPGVLRHDPPRCRVDRPAASRVPGDRLEALEAAGHDPAAFAGRIGVFAGSSPNSYLLRNVLPDRAAVLRYTADYQTASYPTLLGAGADFLATRVAYKLDLRGPAVTVATACSTALVAVAQACAALRAGDADMALAGGVSISLPQQRGYVPQPGGLASIDGHVRPYDAAASGTVFGSGAGVVLLRRLADAVRDGDHIHAVIAGIATNNDGAAKVGFTAPGVTGQAACVTDAQVQAGVAPAAIGFVEGHGTATPLGDPIEFAALRQVFGAEGSCVLGSAKGNIGHLDAAAGAAGLIKAVLAVEHATVPGTLHFRAPNPAMPLAGSPFRITAQTEPWSGATPRHAGVSAFGVGGTNAHAVLAQAPARVPVPGRAHQVVILSARSTDGLAEAQSRLLAHLTGTKDDLADIAWTSQLRRRFAHRLAIPCRDTADAVAALVDGRAVAGQGGADGVAFLFPGQGAQHPGMGHQLYRDEPAYRDAIDRCAAILQPLLGRDLRAVLFEPGHEAELRGTELAQPALFATGYALAQLWQGWGVRPSAMLGHSVGEFVAACLAGVFSLEDALGLITARGAAMAGLPGGAMLAVRLGEAELLPLLGDALDLAAVNAPAACVAAGPVAAVDALEAALTARGAMHRRLATSHAFHSRTMDGAVAPLRAAAGRVTLSPPALPFMSGVTGTWITPEQATSPEYWAQHCRAPVRFAAGLETLLARTATVLLECGPGRTLTTLALQGAARGRVVAPSLPDAAGDEHASLAAAAARLAAAGVEPDWRAMHGAGRRRVPLPATPWERVRCWIDEPTATTQRLPEAAPTMDHPAADDTLAELVALFEELSGDRLGGVDPATDFLQLGFDSLFLGQVAQQLKSRFGVSVTFRQLLGELGSFTALAATVRAGRPVKAVAVAPTPPAPVIRATPAPAGSAALMQQQVAAMSALFAQQLAALGEGTAKPSPAGGIGLGGAAEGSAREGVWKGSGGEGGATPQVSAAGSTSAQTTTPTHDTLSSDTARFDAFKPVAAGSGALTPGQRAHVDALVADTVARTPASKRMTAEARRHLADPRAAAGFRPDWKEMTYPIVAVRSAGPLIWDADGNEYVDLVNGFGQTAFGHAPAFVTAAVRAQLDRGFEIGPQAELAGRVAAQFCRITGNERMTFCNTGSEAVMAAMRIARTVTGRSRIVTFAGSYHGQFDEVLVKAAPKGTRPVASGIPLESVGNITVLDYGSDAALDWIRAHAGELAAVIAEPVQSRHPALQPAAFLRSLRAITEASGTCLVFDEVVTGFRTAPGGMQALLGIRADLATYGKVVGGGMPVGILAGRAAFMDALDGGAWEYGDDSVPEVAVTFFAGTFVRHPLALAAVEAVLAHIEADGPAVYTDLPARTAGLAARLNDILAARSLPRCVEHFASWFYFKLPDTLGSLLYPHMRLRGVHIQEGFPCFLTTTHGAAEIDRIAAAFADSLDALQAAGILLPEGAVAPAPTGARLTEAQMEIWLASQLGDGASCSFNEGVSLHLRGPLDVAALRDSLARLLARHDALRARFSATGERFTIGPVPTLSLPVEDGPLAAVLDAEATAPFDLVAGPPIRLRLVRVAAEHHVLVLTAHHIICDGWSINTLLAELAEAGPLPPALSFAAFAAGRGSRAAADLAWWQGQFATAPAALDLPADRVRPALRSFRGGTRRLALDAAALAGIKRAGAASGATLFTTLLAAVGVTLGRLAGRSELVVAVPAAAQSQMDGAVLVGHCANLLPVRAAWTDATPFADHLRAVRATVLDAYEHQDCTLGTIVRALALPRDTSRLPLTGVQFNLERLADGMAMPGLALTVSANPKAFVNFDLFFNAVESRDGLAIDCDYNADLFDPATVDRWLGHLRTALDAVSADPARPIGTLTLLTTDEQDMLLHRWNATAAPLPDGPVHAMIAAQAARTPDATAMRFGDVSLSYAELDARANAMAHRLLAHAAPGGRVAVMLDRTPDLVATLLGAWKAGLAYVPLDPSHPRERLMHVLADAGASVLVTDGSGPALDAPTLDVRSAADAPATPPEVPAAAEAYVIYTSGSTGSPKGVSVGHAALGNLLLSVGREPGIAPGDVWLAVTTVAFDIAGLELWGPLVAGATVVLASGADAADGHRLRALLSRNGATAMQATPSTWRLLLENRLAARRAADAVRGRGAAPHAGRPPDRRWQPAVEHVRPDRDDDLVRAGPRRPWRGDGRTPGGQHGPARAGRGRPAGADRRAGPAAHWRSRAGGRLPQPAGPNGGAVRVRSVHAGSPAVPNGRCCPPPAGRAHPGARPHGHAAEAARLPAGSGRGRAHAGRPVRPGRGGRGAA